MKKTHLLLQFLFLLIVSTRSFAQEAPDPNTFRTRIPTSPEAATLGKFGDIPVGLFTGVPNISVPLYTLKAKNFELPINLSYNSSGIRVEEHATNTGLGWSLNAGGMISCAVNGLRDFWANGIAAPTMAEDSLPPYILSPGLLDYDFGQSGGGVLYRFAKRVADGTIDTKPDLFSFNFLGRSGKFYTDNHRQLHTMPFMPLKISIDVTSMDIKIIDEQGRKFFFKQLEGSIMTNSCGPDITNQNWLLTKIELPDKTVINFNYTAVNYSYKVHWSYKRKTVVPGYYPLTGLDCNDFSDVLNMGSARLTSITSNAGHSIEFKYLNNRTDLPGTRSLDSIIVKNRNKVVDKIGFNYSYFHTTGSTADDYRLKLLSVRNQSGAIHSFNYNETIPIPNRLSFAQDHWGYFNGKVNNTTLLPIDQAHNFFTGADREVDSSYTQMALLKQITYPTGGYTKFNYEQNDYFYSGAETTYHNYERSVYGHNSSIDTVHFTIPVGHTVLTATVNFDDGSGSFGNYPEPVDPATTLTIVGDNGFNRNFYNGLNGSIGVVLTPGNYVMTINCSGAANGAYMTVNYVTSTTQNVEKNKLIGGARVKTVISKASSTSLDEIKQYVYREKSYPTRSSGKVNFHPLYTYISPRYQYPLPDPFEEDWVKKCRDQYRLPMYTQYYQQMANSVYPVGSINGGSVGYTFVTSFNGTIGQNGKTESTFTFVHDNGGVESAPLVPVTSNSWKNGLLTKEVQYINRSGVFQPLASTNNDFSIQPESVFWNYFYDPSTYQSNPYFRGRGVSIEYKRDERFCSLDIYPAQFFVNDFRYISEWVRQDSSRTVNYVYNGATLIDSVITNKQFTYSNPAHMQVNITTTKTSKGTNLLSSQLFPQDYAIGTSTAIDSLVAQYRIATPLESKVNNNGSIQTGTTVYKHWGSGIVEPEYQRSQNGGNAPEDRLRFYSYDSKANILTASQINGPKIAYKWGYQQQFPVAECKNAAADEFFAENFEDLTSGIDSTTTAHTGRKHFNGSFTTSDKLTPGYNGRTYLISWWYKSGSNWLYSGQVAYTGQTLSGDLDDIRIHPTDAQMTTYTYEPLVGMTSATDAKGLTTYYEYDAYQRLMNMKDKDGNILKHTQYHYYNQ